MMLMAPISSKKFDGREVRVALGSLPAIIHENSLNSNRLKLFDLTQ
jgi:hypothetical protein